MGKQRRGRRSGVEDLWTKRDGSPSKRHGRGMRWRARYVDDEGLERTHAFARKAEAQAWVDAQSTAVTLGNHVAPGADRELIADLGEQWLRHHHAHTKQTTKAALRSSWATHVKPQWQSYAVGDIKTSAVRAWLTTMQENGTGAATAERAVGILRQILETAVEDRKLARNPVTGVKPPRRTHSQRAYLTHQQVAQLAGEAGTYSIVVKFLAYTGLRFGEMAALRVQSFDMLRRRVNITEAVAEADGKLVWSTPKTHERRTVPFPAFLSEPLAKLMEGKQRDALVFTNRDGNPLRVSNFRHRVFAPAVKRCQVTDQNFPTLSTHDLRHTAASLAISAGANVKAVQRLLGHKSAAMTLDTYADLFDDDLEAVAEALNRAAALAADGSR